jgi:hypothetical protein
LPGIAIGVKVPFTSTNIASTPSAAVRITIFDFAGDPSGCWNCAVHREAFASALPPCFGPK